jgi:hypothetical protein
MKEQLRYRRMVRSCKYPLIYNRSKLLCGFALVNSLLKVGYLQSVLPHNIRLAQPEQSLGAPATITTVFSPAKLVSATVASGSVPDEASTKKI